MNSADTIRSFKGVAVVAAFCAAFLPRCAKSELLDASQFARTFNVKFSGYAGKSTLTNFPALVRLSKELNDFKYSKCADGSSLRFADLEGNLLPSEIDVWDTNGVSLVWVKVPALDANTVITAHYGCANPPENNPSDVWSEGYVGVWHLAERARPLRDSTAHGLDFTRSSTIANKDEGYFDNRIGFASAGIVGNGVAFDKGATGDHMGGLVAYDQEQVRLDGYDAMTIEVWTCADADNLATNNRYTVTKWKNNNSHGWAYQVYDAANDHRLCSQFRNESDGGVSANPLSGNVQTPGQWNYSVYVYDGDNRRGAVYLDGKNCSNVTGTPSGTVCQVTAPLCLGNRGAGGDPYAYPGSIDEFRISSVARSSDWVKATYGTISNEKFAYYEQNNDWAKYARRINISFPGAPASSLADFPVLVKLSEYDQAEDTGIKGFSYADFAKEKGGDLRFSDESGRMIPHEIDTWNEEGVSYVWVKVPALSSTTKIFAYYGWTFAPAVNPKDVWSNGYVGVWHLGEGARPLLNSTATTGVDFTRSNDSAKDPGHYDDCIDFKESGAAGGAVRFSAYTGEEEAMQRRGGLIAYDTENKLCGFDAISLEIWAKVEQFDTSAQRFLLARRVSGGTKLRPYNITYTASRKACSQIGLDNGLDDNKSSIDHVSAVMPVGLAGAWNFHCFQYDRAMTSHTNYLNGAFSTSKSSDQEYRVLAPAASFICLGNDASPASCYSEAPNSPQVFNGSVDELRISNVARSDAWVQATYDTVKNHDGFTTYSRVRNTTARGFRIFLR